MALFQGLDLINVRAISRLLIFGDSRQVILKMITGYSSGAINYRILFDIIKLLTMGSIEFFHILKENNAQADTLYNVGASLPQGLISIDNSAPLHKPIP